MPAALGRSPREQPDESAAGAVFMVRPARFGWNPQTEASNAFQQRSDALAADAASRAQQEFDVVTSALRTAGIDVFAMDDLAQPPRPDAVFPNNWVSFHADGTVVSYPMLAPNRRLERRMDLVERLAESGSFDIRRRVDLTHYESRGEYLEGTGSLVLDRPARVAYACLSPRTHPGPLRAFCDELGYEPCVFHAHDSEGRPVYHTNVVLSVGPSIAVVASKNIAPGDRDRVLAKLERTGRALLEIDRAQAASFAANVLELRASDDARVLALSAAAAAAFGDEGLARARSAVDRFAVAPIPTIEALGGGSVRCMIAEVFLPKGRVP